MTIRRKVNRLRQNFSRLGQILARMLRHISANDTQNGTNRRVSAMKSRWQKSLETAVAQYDTPLPWARGDIRKAMIARREERLREQADTEQLQAQTA